MCRRDVETDLQSASRSLNEVSREAIGTTERTLEEERPPPEATPKLKEAERT